MVFMLILYTRRNNIYLVSMWNIKWRYTVYYWTQKIEIFYLKIKDSLDFFYVQILKKINTFYLWIKNIILFFFLK